MSTTDSARMPMPAACTALFVQRAAWNSRSGSSIGCPTYAGAIVRATMAASGPSRVRQ
jgi:hypothetical protein